MFHHPRVRRNSAAVALIAIVMFSSGGRAATAQGTQGTGLLGPIGVAQNEAVRLNISAVGDAGDVPWDFVVRIFNTRGEVAAERRLPLAPGVTRSLEVNIGNPDIFPVETPGRRTLRAEIVGFNPQPDPPGMFVATLEVYNLQTGGPRASSACTFRHDD